MPPSDITEPLSLPVVPPIPPRCQGKPALPASSPCAKRQTRSVLFNERISRKAHENTAVPAMSSLLPVKPTVPLIVDGKDVVGARSDHVYKDDSDKDDLVGNWHFQGADINLCRAAVESSAKAYPAWAATPPTERRRLFLKLAQVNSHVTSPPPSVFMRAQSLKLFRIRLCVSTAKPSKPQLKMKSTPRSCGRRSTWRTVLA